MKRKRKPTVSRIVAPEDMDDMVSLLVHVESWAAAFREHLVRQLEAGVALEKAYLAEGVRLRNWDPNKPQEEVIKGLQKTLKKLKRPATVDAVAPRVLRSPAQIEEEIGRTQYDLLLRDSGLVEVTRGKRSLRLKP